MNRSAPACPDVIPEYTCDDSCGSPIYYRVQSGEMSYSDATVLCLNESATISFPKSGSFSYNDDVPF